MIIEYSDSKEIVVYFPAGADINKALELLNNRVPGWKGFIKVLCCK